MSKKKFRVAQCLPDMENEPCKKVVINAGRKDGIKLGDKFMIYSLGDEICDPITKDRLGVLEIVKGRGKAIHVQENISTIESIKVKKAGTKRIVYDRPGGPYGSNFLTSLMRTTKEEFVKDGEDEIIPFENVEKGDYAKFIE